MALGDFRVLDGHRWGAFPYRTKAGQTAIKAGEFVLQDVSGDEEYVQVAPNASDNDDIWVGVAVTNDTNSASADGVVYVVDAVDAKFVGKPTTSSNLASTVLNTKVTLDVASTVQTIDENDTTKGVLMIKSYDTARNEVVVQIDRSDMLNS